MSKGRRTVCCGTDKMEEGKSECESAGERSIRVEGGQGKM